MNINTSIIKKIIGFLVLTFVIFYFFISLFGTSESGSILSDNAIGEDLFILSAQISSVLSDPNILSYIENVGSVPLISPISVSPPTQNVRGRTNPFANTGNPVPVSSSPSELSTPTNFPETVNTPSTTSGSNNDQVFEEEEITL